MRKIARTIFLFCSLSLLSVPLLNSQTFHLDISGDARIAGRLDLGDTTLRNTFAGHNSGIANTSGHANAIFGHHAGLLNQTGAANSFFGETAGRHNTDGSSNSYFGNSSGFQNQSGFNNSFFGADAGGSNITGSRNSMFGSSAGFFTTSSDNSFFGFAAGLENISGTHNVCVGKNAGLNNTQGSRNTILGSEAGDGLTTGSNNTIIGYKAQGSVITSNNQVVIGYRADGQGNNTVTLGNEFITSVYMGEDGMASVVSSSDIRMKKDIEDSNLGLNFITALRPVSYNWKARKDFPASFVKNEADHELEQGVPQKILQHGLIAQEVKAVIDQMGIKWQGWYQNEQSGRQGLTYSALTVPLIKAVQELNVKNSALREIIKSHTQTIQILTDRIDQLESPDQ